MRMQARFEVTEGTGGVIDRWQREQKNFNAVLQSLSQMQLDKWREKEKEGYYLEYSLHFYFVWDPRIHHESDETGLAKFFSGKSMSPATNKCIERTRKEHADLLAEFESIMSGIETGLQTTGLAIERLATRSCSCT